MKVFNPLSDDDLLSRLIDLRTRLRKGFQMKAESVLCTPSEDSLSVHAVLKSQWEKHLISLIAYGMSFINKQ